MFFRNIFLSIGIALIAGGLGLALFLYTQTGMPAPALAGFIPATVGGTFILVALKLNSIGDMGPLREIFSFGADPTLPPNAQIAVGTVEGLDRTHLTVNDIPQYRIRLRVRGVDMREFTGELKMLISPHQMAAVAPGTILPVAYLPENPGKLYRVPAQRQPEAQALFQRQQVQLGLADPRAAEISERGVSVTGVVMSMTPTGEIRQGYTGVDATVRFTNSNGSLVERSKRVFLPQSMLGQLGVGRQVDMRVLPDDDTQFIFELNSVDAASW